VGVTCGSFVLNYERPVDEKNTIGLARGKNRLNLLYLAVPPDSIELTTDVEASG
jgi:hypothetical protein